MTNIKIHLNLVIIYILINSACALNETHNVNNSNICQAYVPHTTVITITTKESYQVFKRKWCFKLPTFRCVKTDTDFRTVTQQRTISVVKSTDTCCSGYTLQEDRCVSVCTEPCINGRCVTPENCECEEGYFGKTCDICLKCGSKCPENYYGLQCEHKCNCYNNATCDNISGNCTCSAGWRDEDCNTPCPKGYFGINCSQRCDQSKTICDHVTGKNICRDGFLGSYCEKPCTGGTYGRNCTKLCTCKNDAVCNVENGKCECKPGWQGENCDIPCKQGKFGINCQQNCLCSKGSLCGPTDGQCRCLPGWKGIYCTEQCNYGYYGEHCAKPCNCTGPNFICDHIEGCKCPDSFIGELCDVNINDKYEPLVDEKISIEMNNTALYIVIAVLALIIALIGIGFAVFCYRRHRRRQALQDVLNVRYTANSFVDIKHLNNCPKIFNNLGNQKSKINIEIIKSGSSSRVETESAEPLMKNLNADTTNLNISQETQNNYINMNRISEEPEPIYENVDMIKAKSC